MVRKYLRAQSCFYGFVVDVGEHRLAQGAHSVYESLSGRTKFPVVLWYRCSPRYMPLAWCSLFLTDVDEDLEHSLLEEGAGQLL